MDHLPRITGIFASIRNPVALSPCVQHSLSLHESEICPPEAQTHHLTWTLSPSDFTSQILDHVPLELNPTSSFTTTSHPGYSPRPRSRNIWSTLDTGTKYRARTKPQPPPWTTTFIPNPPNRVNCQSLGTTSGKWARNNEVWPPFSGKLRFGVLEDPEMALSLRAFPQAPTYLSNGTGEHRDRLGPLLVEMFRPSWRVGITGRLVLRGASVVMMASLGQQETSQIYLLHLDMSTSPSTASPLECKSA